MMINTHFTTLGFTFSYILKPPSRMFEHSESVNGVIIVLSLLVCV